METYSWHCSRCFGDRMYRCRLCGVFCLTCNLDVGSFVYHSAYGYGEITTVNEDHTMVFIDFRGGFSDWFEVEDILHSNCVFPSENSFVRVIFKEGDNIKDILQRYSEYRYIDILF